MFGSQLYLSRRRQRHVYRLPMPLDSHLGDKRHLWQQSGGSGTPLLCDFLGFLTLCHPDSCYPPGDSAGATNGLEMAQTNIVSSGDEQNPCKPMFTGFFFFHSHLLWQQKQDHPALHLCGTPEWPYRRPRQPLTTPTPTSPMWKTLKSTSMSRQRHWMALSASNDVAGT